MIPNEKSFNYKVLEFVKLYNLVYMGCVSVRVQKFWKFESQNLIILKQISRTLNIFISKLVNYKVSKCIYNYNFVIDYVNIRTDITWLSNQLLFRILVDRFELQKLIYTLFHMH